MFAIATPPPAAGRITFGKAQKKKAGMPAQTASAPRETLASVRAERFERELQGLNLRNARLGAWLVMVLVPLCGVLDWLAYPHLFWPFFALRVACAAACVPLLLALDGPHAGRYHRLYPVVLPVLPAVAICAMMYLSGDASSPYYAGLCLCLVGTSFVFHWTSREIGMAVGLIVTCYLAATVPNLDLNGESGLLGRFINNTLFIFLTCVILYLGSRQHQAIRRREFDHRCQMEVQREELRERNGELTAALRRLREAEAQLTQSEKLASIGRLSAGIIHEINNPLNYMKMAVHVLQEKAKTMPGELAESVGSIVTDIKDGVDRVGAIVSDLRSFAHPEIRAAKPVDVGGAVARALRMLDKPIGDARVQVRCDLPPNLMALGDDNQISQIVLNLVQNSLDALAGRDDRTIEIRAAAGGGRIELFVRDRGKGIPADELAHVFDPFFTTKDVGQGMGLGLSLCYRMMQQMRGDIEVRSEVGKFTEFKLTFLERQA